MNAAANHGLESELDFRILGPLEVRREGLPIALGPRKQRALLALLLLEANHVVARDRLVDELWAGAPPPGALKTLRSYLSRLRAVLGVRLIVSRAPGYALVLRTEQLDSERFARLSQEGHEALARGTPALAADRLHDALALWRGPPLADLDDEPSLRSEATRLEELRLAAVEGRIEAELALGRHQPIVGELETLVAEHPLRERPRAQLMLALYRSGRQADALAVYRETRKTLVEELGIEPGRALQGLEKAILSHDSDLDLAPVTRTALRPEPSDNLPAQLTTFVGRERELAELRRLLQTERLVTLTGVGGCGKTRLALEAASHALADFRDGVSLVEFAPISEESLVSHALAATLGLRERADRPAVAGVIDELRHRQLLLVLDNCEHLIEACAPLAEQLLRSCLHLRILATSRERLAIRGELNYRLAPLAVPASHIEDAEQLLAYESVRLFLDRGSASRRELAAAPKAVTTVGRICRELDGLPLAIELAAARVSALSLEEIAERLDQRFRFLRDRSRTTVARHQTLEAAMSWSYELLPEQERTLLRGLAVFAGGFTIKSAAAVCLDGDEHSTLDHVDHLVDASLVIAEQRDSETRYRLLETVRQYGAERLAEAGETQTVRDHHAAYFLALAEQAWAAIDTTNEGELLPRLEQEHDNLRAALDWSLAHQASDVGPRLARALGNFWRVHGHLNEGRSWLERALSAHGTRRTALRADLVGWLGSIHLRLNQFARARESLEEAVALARQMGSKQSEGRWLHYLAFSWRAQTEYGRARKVLGRAVQLKEAIGDLAGAAMAHGSLADIAMLEGRLDEAEQLYERADALLRDAGSPPLQVIMHLGSSAELAFLKGDLVEAQRLADDGLDRARAIGDTTHVGDTLGTLARVARARGELGLAHRLGKETLAQFWALREMDEVAASLETLAGIELDDGDAREAVVLAGTAAAIRERHKAPLAPVYRGLHERDLATLRSQLGEATLQDLWRQCERIDLEKAVAAMLAAPVPAKSQLPAVT